MLWKIRTFWPTQYLRIYSNHSGGFPGGASDKECTHQCRRHKRHRFDPWIKKIPWRRKWRPSPVFLHGESHRQRSLVGYSPWGCKESDTTEVTYHKLQPFQTSLDYVSFSTDHVMSLKHMSKLLRLSTIYYRGPITVSLGSRKWGSQKLNSAHLKSHLTYKCTVTTAAWVL